MKQPSLNDFPLSESVRRKLEVLLKDPRPSQLWVGPADSGMIEALRSMIASFYCQGFNKPCGSCAACSEFHSQSLSELYWLTPDEKNTISLDRLRDFQSWLHLKSFRGWHRFAVIENAECLTGQAQNRLLKVYEESPSKLSIILVTSRPDALLSTIRSRSFAVRFSLPSDRDIEHYLEKMGQSDRWPELKVQFHRLGFSFQQLKEGKSLDSSGNDLLTEILTWFQLSRAEFTTRFHDVVTQAAWVQDFRDHVELVVQMYFDLWKVENGIKELAFPNLLDVYRIVLKQTQRSWLDDASQCEQIARDKHRHFQDQLQLEGLFYSMFLGQSSAAAGVSGGPVNRVANSSAQPMRSHET